MYCVKSIYTNKISELHEFHKYLINLHKYTNENSFYFSDSLLLPILFFYLGESRVDRNCESCNEKFSVDKSTKNGNYFLYLPMKHQIKDLLGQDKLKQI